MPKTDRHWTDLLTIVEEIKEEIEAVGSRLDDVISRLDELVMLRTPPARKVITIRRRRS